MVERRVVRASRALLAGALLSACSPESSTSPPPDPAPLFVDRARQAGLDFRHFADVRGDLLYAEMMGSGCALFDYDLDGDLDVYLVQGGRLRPVEPSQEAAGESAGRDRLFRNDGAQAPAGGGIGPFVDVTPSAGSLADGYGMGVAIGDIDRDDLPDLYVTQLGANALLRNLGDGSFEERAREGGVADEGWGVPAVFFDYDRDGYSDLYVGNYVDYSVATDRECFAATGARDYCGPTTYPPSSDRLFRNRGDGTFEDVSTRTGVGRRGRTLGAAAADLDGDGRVDLYVANDGEPNYLWLNRGGAFAESALAAGVAVDGNGSPEASMGVEVADFDEDGRDDLVLTHLAGETHTLYLNRGGGRFAEATRSSGLGPPSLPMTGFGVAALDVDLDGRLDLVTLNGAVKRLEALVRAGDSYALAQQRQLFRNLGGGRFERTGSGPGGDAPAVGRGAAAGDVDNDGDLDLLINNNSGNAGLLVLEGAAAGWVGLSLPGGSRARIQLGPRTLVRSARVDGSYASSRDPRVLFGLDGRRGSVDVLVEGPDRRALFRGVPSGHYLVVHR